MSENTDAGELVERAATAYRALADLAETVEDEWQFVNDLVDAYLPSIRGLAPDPDAPAAGEVAAAVEEAIGEIALVTDPHKAIDWLSTFPHIVALALGGDVDAVSGPGEEARSNGTAGGPDDDDDSPFAALLRGRR